MLDSAVVSKHVDNSQIKQICYSYDAGGNALATYSRTRRLNSSDATYNYYSDGYSINDHLVYDASRLGSEQENLTLVNKGFKQLKTGNSTNVELRQNWIANPPDLFLPISDYTRRTVGDKRYELSNHLGNVLEVISDRKVRFMDNGTLVYAADVVSYADYSPYGTLLEADTVMMTGIVMASRDRSVMMRSKVLETATITNTVCMIHVLEDSLLVIRLNQSILGILLINLVVTD